MRHDTFGYFIYLMDKKMQQSRRNNSKSPRKLSLKTRSIFGDMKGCVLGGNAPIILGLTVISFSDFTASCSQD